MKFLITSLFFCATVFVQSIASAQPKPPADWPCIQQLVPEVNAAVIWPVPITDDIKGKWSEDEAISELSREFGELDLVTDETREQIVSFAEAIPENERTVKLNMLADGILAVTNERRSLFINGIKRYTRQQQAIALQVEEQLNKLDAMQNETGEAADKQRTELKETAQWHQRVFDQREQTITALCDRPVELEMTLGEVLRELAQFLP